MGPASLFANLRIWVAFLPGFFKELSIVRTFDMVRTDARRAEGCDRRLRVLGELREVNIIGSEHGVGVEDTRDDW